MATDEVNHPEQRLPHAVLLHPRRHRRQQRQVARRAQRDLLQLDRGRLLPRARADRPRPGVLRRGRRSREDSDVVGNLFVKKRARTAPTPTSPSPRVGGDGTGQTWGRYRFVNNTVRGAARARSSASSTASRASRCTTTSSTASAAAGDGHAHRRGGVGERRAVSSGSNNWVTTGSTSVPAPWTGTLTGSQPGLHATPPEATTPPPPGAPSSTRATTTPEPRRLPLPRPALPARLPPARSRRAPSAPRTRGPTDGAVDIGAFERGSGARRSSRSPTSP